MSDFSQLIHASMEWAVTACFRPFKIKKWLIMGAVALMAGYVTSSFRLNLPTDFLKSEKETQTISTQQAPVVGAAQSTSQAPAKTPDQSLQKPEKETLNPALLVLIVVGVGLLILCLVVLMTWLYARFSFVFLDNVVKNDASVKLPFVKYGASANSFFYFNLSFIGICLFLFGILILAAFLFFS